ncbi:MAG: hypothetical protein IKB34_02435 [Clostridia bacterium]|nr:hypothetical protein [Clostridia bacterium]
MIKLQPIFSDHALFLHSSSLTLRGITDSATVTALLSLNGAQIATTSAQVNRDGVFEATFSTPAASFDSYEITVSTENESVVLHDILFGELWLASGQSNMEMANKAQIEHPEYLDSLQGKNLRFFFQRRNPGGHTGIYPYEPDYTMEGQWVTMDNRALLLAVSACATAFSNKLYTLLNSVEGSTIPVGFVNSSVGGTLIEPWLPRAAYENNKEISDYLHAMNRYPDVSSWNTKGDGNYQQTSCMFNQLIAPHIGSRFRGIIWYQGESNCGSEFSKRIYAKLLKALRESYKEIFAASSDEVFPIISSMIYPWTYGADGETNVGYLNKAFSDLAEESPAEYPFIPICDLKPVWAVHLSNHPIHPIHKYPLGERMGLICANSLYGRAVRNVQKLPPMLKRCVRRGNALRLTFSYVGSGLYIKGRNIRGMYVCGENGVYTPAKCDIISKNSLLVYAPGVKKPVHVAYAVSSYEVETNLFAGEFPVAPFGTQLGDTSKPMNIQLKPWLNTENDSEFICNFSATLYDVYRQPIFHASEGSTVCFDTDFSLTGRSVRVHGNTPNKLGVYVLAHRYNAIDLYNYSALNASFMNTAGLSASLLFHYAEKDGVAITVSVPGERKEELAGGWTNYSFVLDKLPKGTVKKMEFSFRLESNPLPYVNIDNIWLSEK